MRSFTLATLSAVMLVIAASGAVLAAPPYHEVIHDSGQDDDFCGTGQTVSWSADGVINWGEDQGFGHLTTTWVNPTNGASIVDSFAGGGKFFYIDDGDGAYTLETVREGLPASLRVANGPVLIHDTGLVAVYDHFDANDNFLGEDFVILGGPHPSLENQDLWCELAVAALGL